MKYLFDTHVWIWWLMVPEKLSSRVMDCLLNLTEGDELLLSAISPWEFCKLLEKGRIKITCNPEEWLRKAFDQPQLRLVPLSPTLAYHSTILPQPFHSDPADQIITATARFEKAVILTRDELILRYPHVDSIW